VAGLLRHAPQLRHFFTEPGFYLGAPLGECGLLASISASNPPRALAYFPAGPAGAFITLTMLYRGLAGTLGAVPRAPAGMGLNDGAYDKLVAKVAEPDFPLDLLPPYQSSSDDGYRAYLRDLSEHYPGWLPTR